MLSVLAMVVLPLPPPSAPVAPPLLAVAADAGEQHGRQDYATAQRLAARGAHPDALVERCGLSPAEAYILVAMHEMKPARD